jgi:hypothetical protein
MRRDSLVLRRFYAIREGPSHRRRGFRWLIADLTDGTLRCYDLTPIG